jgi:Phenylalanyl-tRNA synthetase alpha subunit
MLKQIEEHILDVEKFEADSIESAEHFRIKYLGKKGVLNDLFLAFKNVPNEEKKAFGQALNKLKIKAQEKVDALQKHLKTKRTKAIAK